MKTFENSEYVGQDFYESLVRKREEEGKRYVAVWEQIRTERSETCGGLSPNLVVYSFTPFLISAFGEMFPNIYTNLIITL